MARRKCTIHASGVFSLFSALSFAARTHEPDRIVFFDFNHIFGGKSGFLNVVSPVLDFFSVSHENVTYLTNINDAIERCSSIYTPDGSRVVFAESLQSKDNQQLIRKIGPQELHFYAEGAMSYGPIRDGLPDDITRILKAVHYVAHSPLEPIACEQFHITPSPISQSDWRNTLERFFDLLDRDFRDLTEIDAFLASAPTNPVCVVHQNLSAISKFPRMMEGRVFKDIVSRSLESLDLPVLVFLHPKIRYSYKDIFSTKDPRVVFAAPSFPFSEYYISRINAAAVVGVFSTALLNLHDLGLPVTTLHTETVGNNIPHPEDSNIYALHYCQIVLRSFYSRQDLAPGRTPNELASLIRFRHDVRCEEIDKRLWHLPYALHNSKIFARNKIQYAEDYASLGGLVETPAFRRVPKERISFLSIMRMKGSQRIYSHARNKLGRTVRDYKKKIKAAFR